MRYKNIAGRFFGLVTKQACDRHRRTDRHNYDSQDRTSMLRRAVKNGVKFLYRHWYINLPDVNQGNNSLELVLP